MQITTVTIKWKNDYNLSRCSIMSFLIPIAGYRLFDIKQNTKIKRIISNPLDKSQNLRI